MFSIDGLIYSMTHNMGTRVYFDLMLVNNHLFVDSCDFESSLAFVHFWHDMPGECTILREPAYNTGHNKAQQDL